MKHKVSFEQTSIFEILSGKSPEEMKALSSDDWHAIINAAQKNYQCKKREEKAELKRIEAEKISRQQKEEQQKHDELVKEITTMDLPLDWNNHYSMDERVAEVHAESISDGLILSLLNIGKVDIEYIAQVSGKTYKEVIETLGGSIYQNPDKWGECFYKGWETADEYLSGNLMRKYKAANEANKAYNGYFKENLKAIENILPDPIPGEEIFVTLGSPWVPSDVIDEFIEYLLGSATLYSYSLNRRVSFKETWPVDYEPISGTWRIPEKGRYGKSAKSVHTYGTKRMPALYIIEKTLNMKTLQIFDKTTSTTTASGEKLTLNKDETIAAHVTQQKIIKEFQEWIWLDKARRERLETIFENNFSCVRQRKFDGEFLTFPDLSPDISLYPYQKNAVARILFTPNTLLAHDVGAGKTYVMICAGMKLKRMNISQKNVYVVPNNIVGQWETIFRQMYPQANILVVDPKSFKPSKRQNVIQSICEKDFDAIIIAYSCFDLIPLSSTYYEREIEAELAVIRKALKDRNDNSRLKKRKDALNKELDDIRKALYKGVPEICFDDLNINTLFLDEAHNYKNTSIDTKINKVLGITRTGSTKCNEMLNKVRCVQRMNNGRGVVFATGTPITNSVTDIFVMQTYLQYGELSFLELHHFDNWAATFGETVTDFEVDVDTSTYRLATRFSKFHNLPELSNLLAQIADFHQNDKLNDLPDFAGYEDKLIPKTIELKDYLNKVSERADKIRKGFVKRSDDNMLMLTTDGRKAALDIRLAEPLTAFSYDCKVFRCMENVLNIYRATARQQLTQLVFCDSSTPKIDFNIYDELKSLLIHYGAFEEEIAFIHDYNTEKLRGLLFENVRNGKIRILLGSTFKLGMGVNIQKKLVAIHHLDVPWRPADMIQREGRILRQGNENKEIKIFRYITEGSFDAYSWQLLESKQRFICQLLSGSLTERSASDVDDIVLNYAEIKALAIGNPLIKNRMETANELKKVCALQRKLIETKSYMKQEAFEIPVKIAHAKELAESACLDVNHYMKNRKDIKEIKEHRRFGEMILKALESNVMKSVEKKLIQYQGFIIVLPANMNAAKPFIWIEGNGRYYTEMGDSDIGCINRIDNKLNGLPVFIEEQKKIISTLTERKSEIEKELNNTDSYVAEIEELRIKLEKIDKELGVEK